MAVKLDPFERVRNLVVARANGGDRRDPEECYEHHRYYSLVHTERKAQREHHAG